MENDNKENNGKERLFIKIATIVVSFLVSLVILELLLQGYDYLGRNELWGAKPLYTTITWYEDSLLGNRLNPNQEGWFVTPTGEYQTKIITNNDGWYNTQYSVEKDDETIRIALLGDSFVESFQVSLEDTFFKQLEKKLNDKFEKNIEVYSFGMGDTGTAQQYVLLKNDVLRYQPDIVIHMFLTSNDVRNNIPELGNPYRPYYEIDQSGELVFISPQKQPREGKLKHYIKKSKVVSGILKIKGRLALFTQAKNVGIHPDLLVYDSKNEVINDGWIITKRLILESRKAVEENGGKYYFVSLANNEQIHDDVWESFLELYANVDKNSLNKNRPDEVLLDFCLSQNIECGFMAPSFVSFRENNPEVRTHFPKDGHWNQKGNDLAANFLFEFLIENESITIVTGEEKADTLQSPSED